jgi:predicted outer membrane lipoprotein
MKMSKVSNILTVFFLACAFFVMPAFAFDKIDIKEEMNNSKDPMKSSEMKDAKSLMWDIIKFLCVLFLLSIVINAITSGLSLNVSSFLHSLQIRAHGIMGLFIVVGSIIGVLFALWIGLYLWNTYLANL